MLNETLRGRLTIAVIVWASANIALQTAIRYGAIEYDSPGGLSLIWWFSQLLVLPVTLVSEIAASIGLSISGYVWYLILTCLLALVSIGLIRVASIRR